MKYRFSTPEKNIEIDCLEWLSLLEAAKEMGFEFGDDYTPVWEPNGDRKFSSLGYPVQIVRDAEKLKRALKSIEILIEENEHKKCIPTMLYHTLSFYEKFNDYGKSIFLGCLDGCDYLDLNYYALDRFVGENKRLIEDLIEFCDSPKFMIDWKPLMDNEEENHKD